MIGTSNETAANALKTLKDTVSLGEARQAAWGETLGTDANNDTEELR